MPGAFVGRHRELDAAARALERARAGRGSLLVVAGQSGAGKSRLAHEVLDVAAGRQLRAAFGAGWPEGGAATYWPWQPVLDSIEPGAGQVLDLVPDAPDAERFVRFRSVGEKIARVTAAEPLLVVLDDLHAFDPDGLALTRFVARSTVSLPLVLMVTYRTDADVTNVTAGLLAEIAREGQLLRLEGWTREEIADFLATRSIDAEDARVDRVAELTGGVPFLVEQVVDEGLHDSTGPLPEPARRLLDSRIAQLDDRVRAVVEAAAVLGPGATPFEIAEVARVDQLTVQHAHDVAAALGLVQPSRDDLLHFSHDLAREAMLARTAPARVVELHRRSIDALRHDDRSVERAGRRARHALALVGQSPDDTAAAIDITRASASVLTLHGSPETAVELLSEAFAAHQATGTAASAPLLIDLGTAMLATGRLNEGREVFARALAAADTAREPYAYAEAALGFGGVQVQEQRADEERRTYLDILQRAIQRLAGDSTPPAARLTASLRLKLATERPVDLGSIADARAALDEIRALGDPHDLAAALSSFHHLLIAPAFASEREAVTHELLAVARSAGDDVYTVIGLLWEAVDSLLAGREAERVLAEVRARAEALGMGAVFFLTDAIAVMQRLRAGEMKAADGAATAAFERGMAIGDPDASTYFATHTLAMSWYTGDVIDLLEVAEQLATSTAMPAENPVFSAVVAALAAEAGDVDRATRALDSIGRGHLAELLPTSSWLVTMFVLSEAAVFLDDAALANEVYAILSPYAGIPAVASLGIACFGSVERSLGLLARVAGRTDDAIAHLERAVTHNLHLGNRPVTAVARADLAVTLLQRAQPGDRVRADDLLTKAIDAAERMELQSRATRWRRLRDDVPTPAPSLAVASCMRVGDTWEIVAGDEAARVATSVGMSYLATLLAEPGEEISAGTLAGIDIVAAKQDLLDENARRDFRRRIDALEDEIDSATVRGDEAAVAALQDELDAVLAHAREAAGLGGQSRHFDDSSERARTSVQKAIRRAIDRIARDAPNLAAGLRRSVRTGYQCSYDPIDDAPTHWTVTR